MHITTNMMRQLEQAISPNAEAEIQICTAGFDIRVTWRDEKAIRQINKNVSSMDLGTTEIARERMDRAWERLVASFQELKDRSETERREKKRC